MVRRGTSFAALALVIALVAAPAAASAKPHITPAQRITHIIARGTNGWQLQIGVVLGRAKDARVPIGFYTLGPHHQEVDYVGAKGRATEDGLIAARAPGFGRVSVHFEQTSEEPVTDVPAPGCRVKGKGASLEGVFRGTIEFHGEGGYTTVERQSAPGEIDVIAPEICPRSKRRRPPPPETSEGASIEHLLAGRQEGGGGSLTFDAFAIGPMMPGEGPFTDFSATYTHRRGKLTIDATTSVPGKEEGEFSLTAPGGTPTEATVHPPAPFSGTGTFKLESPTTASWTGDLSVKVPTLGRVDLTEPGFWAGACAAYCTRTFPEGLRIGFLTASPLALGRSG